jgi:hypothetical protein
MASSRSVLIGDVVELRDYAPVLRWLILNGLAVVVVVALWYFGLLWTMLSTDRTHISLLILVLFALTALHCLYQTTVVSNQLVAARKIGTQLAEFDAASLHVGDDGRVLLANGRPLAPGVLASHIANLVRKAEALRGGRLDQTLLLRSLADRLRNREKLGLFVSEGLLRLALLGTAIGFILMLIPISRLTSFDPGTLRLALSGMTGGMAIALNVTVTGIGSALVLKFEYFLLDDAISDLFETVTETTEVYVVPALETRHDARS